MTDKPTIHFDLDQPYSVTSGNRGDVCPIDHPSDKVSNNGMVTTSLVERVHVEGGQVFFETENSYYRGIHLYKED